MIYDLCTFITLIPIHFYRGKSAMFSFKSLCFIYKIAGITALFMSLNSIQYSSHLKENIKENL